MRNPAADDYHMLTVQEASELCGIAPAKLYRMIEHGTIAARRDRRSVYIRRASLIQWIETDEPAGEMAWSTNRDDRKVLDLSPSARRRNVDDGKPL